jgi:hypothetical protein
MPSYSLNLHLLWSGGPPREGEQGYLRDLQKGTGTAATVAASADTRALRDSPPQPIEIEGWTDRDRYTRSDAVHFEEEARA